MKTFIILLVLFTISSLCVQAQTVNPTPKQPTYSDSVGRPSPSVLPMGTEFYRKASDPENMVRAELDNMPIKTPDSSQQYRMLNPHQRYGTPPTSPRLEEMLPKRNTLPEQPKQTKP